MVAADFDVVAREVLAEVNLVDAAVVLLLGVEAETAGAHLRDYRLIDEQGNRLARTSLNVLIAVFAIFAVDQEGAEHPVVTQGLVVAAGLLLAHEGRGWAGDGEDGAGGLRRVAED